MPTRSSISGRWRALVADRPQRRVLVVDDASLVRLYYRDALERAGFEVDEALNGLEALEKLLVAPVDLLIVDVNMPQMDGLTFLQRAAAPGPTRSPPFRPSSPAPRRRPHDIAAARGRWGQLSTW